MNRNVVSLGATKLVVSAPLLTVTASAILGASVGLAVAYSIPSATGVHQAFVWLWPFAVWAATLAGIFIGTLAGVTLVQCGKGGVACPRCGTSNPESAPSCSACELDLAG